MRTNVCRAVLIFGALLALSEQANATWTPVYPTVDARLWSLAMQIDDRAVEQSTSDFSAELARHFEDLSVESGCEIDARRVRGIWDQGLFAATVAAESSPTIDGIDTLGLVRFSTPRDLPLQALGGREIPPGDYAILAYPNGSVHLGQVGGSSTVPISPAGTVAKAPTDSLPPCSKGWQLEIDFRLCEVCITAVCPGVGVVLLGCVRSPICDLASGLIDVIGPWF